jgi:ABC-2 type transport system ATP-binding protein
MVPRWIIGPNGAGKSTLVQTVLGILEADSGRIFIDGIDAIENRTRAVAKTNFAAVYAPLPANLTVQQNLRVFGLLYRTKQLSNRIDDMIRQLNLSATRTAITGTLSSGQLAKVAIAKAVLTQPKLLILDEATASLDPLAADEIRRFVQRVSRDLGCGVLWASHNMQEVTHFCDRLCFIINGRVLVSGSPRELIKQYRVASLEALFLQLALP